MTTPVPNPFAFPGAVIQGDGNERPWPAQDYLSPHFAGMTLRDYFAGQALTGLCNFHRDSKAVELWMIAEESYEIADEMLQARNKQKESQ